jgi:acetyl esterase
MPLDPETRAFLDKLAASATKPRHLMTPSEGREAFSRLRNVLPKGCEVRTVAPLAIPVAGGVLPGRLFVPFEEPSAIMVYFHGGGWVVGSLEEFDPLCREIARAAGMAVVLVEYRKAPEHPFPGPVDDAWAATLWVAEHAAGLVGRDLALLVGGDSAGGNLAIAVTLRARAAGAPMLAGQLLVYPVTDSRFDRPSYQDPANQLMTNRDVMHNYWNRYVPDEAMRSLPEASPCREPNLRGLPPAVVVTAEYDVLRDEGEDYADRLRAAGVPVDLRRFAGQMHGFLMMIDILSGAAIGVDFVGVALRQLIRSTQATL